MKTVNLSFSSKSTFYTLLLKFVRDASFYAETVFVDPVI